MGHCWWKYEFTHWGRMTHICVCKLTIIGSDNDLSPLRCQAIIWTGAGKLIIRTLETDVSEVLSEIHTFWLINVLEMSSAKWRKFCLGIHVLTTPIHRAHLRSNESHARRFNKCDLLYVTIRFWNPWKFETIGCIDGITIDVELAQLNNTMLGLLPHQSDSAVVLFTIIFCQWNR